jgi:hypothetical protein
MWLIEPSTTLFDASARNEIDIEILFLLNNPSSARLHRVIKQITRELDVKDQMGFF